MKKVISKFCPICLKENQYHRIYWHLRDIVMCPFHNVYLVDTCIYCNRKLYPAAISAGKCCCGKLISGIPSQFVDSEDIIRNQIRICKAYRIISGNDSENFFGLSETTYITFIRFLVYIVRNLHKNCSEDQYAFYTERLLSDWPNGFMQMLNNLFENEFLISKFGKMLNTFESGLWNVNKKSVYNLRVENSAIEEVDFLHKELCKFLYEMYQSGAIKKKFKDILHNNKYISIEKLKYYFAFDTYSIKDLFNVTLNNEYVSFNEVRNFFIEIIKNSAKQCSKGHYIQVTEVYRDFKGIGISMTDIFSTINSKNIEYYINPFFIGLNTIFLHGNKIKKALLEFAIEKLDNDKF